MLPKNRILDHGDPWGVQGYADGIVECVDMRFLSGGIYKEGMVPAYPERKEIVNNAKLEVRQRITICLTANEVLAARAYLEGKIGSARQKCDAWRKQNMLNEQEMIAMNVCSQNLQCMIFVRDILKDLERGKYQRWY